MEFEEARGHTAWGGRSKKVKKAHPLFASAYFSSTPLFCPSFADSQYSFC